LSRTLGHATTGLQYVIAKPSEIPAAAQRILQLDPQQIG
jgi:hypothetical protein